MKKCKLISCGNDIIQCYHGNRSYCSDICYYQAKLERNRTKYSKTKKQLFELNRNESILRMLYNKHGSDVYINSLLFNENLMNWSFFTGETTINDLKAKVVGEYAYCLFINKTVQIWKL